jgi:exopolysaccharide production protein ExoY
LAVRADEASLPLSVNVNREAHLDLRVPSTFEVPLRSVWIGKRALDIVLSLALIVLLAPLMLTVAAVVKLTTPGPILFSHRRIGRGGREIGVLKFRTMHLDAEQRLRSDKELLELYLACNHKIPHHLDPRITKVGGFLRRSSIDELPQLFNVLAGSMSLVGPRPVVSSELVHYEHHKNLYTRLRPGLTGLWQVSGRCTVKFPERAQLDAYYSRNCKLLVDLKILLKTPWAVLRGLNAD